MDKFQYELKKKEVDNLTTKKSKKIMLTEFLTLYKPTYYNVKILMYLLHKHSEDLVVGTQLNERIKHMLLQVTDSLEYDDDLFEYCNTPYTLSEFHADKLYSSRYLPYQVAAYMKTQELKY